MSDEIKKLLRQGKIETIKYYRENPQSFDVVIGTDLISLVPLDGRKALNIEIDE